MKNALVILEACRRARRDIAYMQTIKARQLSALKYSENESATQNFQHSGEQQALLLGLRANAFAPDTRSEALRSSEAVVNKSRRQLQEASRQLDAANLHLTEANRNLLKCDKGVLRVDEFRKLQKVEISNAALTLENQVDEERLAPAWLKRL